MELAPPPLDEAQPGKPITAQAWNALKDSILALYEALNGLDQGSVVVVEAKAEGKTFPNALVVARQGEKRIAAVPPIGNQTTYVLSGLTEGEWTVTAIAEGYKKVEKALTIPSESVLGLTLERDESVVMPDLFGNDAKSALVTLDARGITIDRVFDTSGKELTRTELQKGAIDNLVLYQQPAAGSFVVPKVDRARLVIGAAVASKTVATVPDIEGLSFEQAQKKLAEVGLSIKEVAVLGEKA